MLVKTYSHRRLLFLTLGLTYLAIGQLGTLPAASLLRLASNTHVSLEVASSMFTASSIGGMLGVVLSGLLVRALPPKYLLVLGLCCVGFGSVTIVLTSSFLVLLLGQLAIGLAFGFVDIGLNTIATLAFEETLAADLNAIHGLFGLGALLGPLALSAGLLLFSSLELAYFVGAGITAIAMLLVLVQQLPELPPGEKRVEHQQGAGRTMLKVLRQRMLWLMVFQISLYSAAEMGVRNWIVTAVSQSAAVSLALAAPVATAFFLGITIGRLLGSQVLTRGWFSERQLLATALVGGTLWSLVVAMCSSHLLISYAVSALVGCCYGPLHPGIMAIASRRFVHALGPVSSVMLISTDVAAMIVPPAMGLLIPLLGINWVMTIPALCCALIVLPMTLSNRAPPESHIE